MLYLYNFEVKHWYEIENDQYIAKGTVAGHTYSEALETVVEYFGEDNIIEIKLSFIADSDNGLLVLDDATSITKQPKQHQYLQEEK